MKNKRGILRREKYVKASGRNVANENCINLQFLFWYICGKTGM
jgi:hypothetical protein